MSAKDSGDAGGGGDAGSNKADGHDQWGLERAAESKLLAAEQAFAEMCRKRRQKALFLPSAPVDRPFKAGDRVTAFHHYMPRSGAIVHGVGLRKWQVKFDDGGVNAGGPLLSTPTADLHEHDLRQEPAEPPAKRQKTTHLADATAHACSDSAAGSADAATAPAAASQRSQSPMNGNSGF